MKTINFHIALLLGFFLLPAISRSKQIPLRLTENQELIYEWTAKKLILTPNSVIDNEAKTIRYSLLVNKITNDKVFLTAQILRNSTDHSQYPGDFTDVRFPQCAKKYEIPSVDRLSEEVLYQIEFQFELDLNTHVGKLTNRVEILEQSFTILKNKGSSEEIRSKVIELINKWALQEKCNLFLHPFLFMDTDIDQPDFHHQKLGAGFSMVNQNEKQVELKNNAEDGKPIITCIVDKQDGLLSGFINEITSKPKPGNNSGTRIRQTEQLTLLRKSLKKPQQLIVCGHIENPVGDQLELYTLSEPFGNDLDVKNVSLDENKNFRIKTNFENEGFVLVSNLNKNQNVPGPVILLYAEPGDSLYLQAKLVTRKFQQKTYFGNDSIGITDKDYVVAETISFSGDRRSEAELLNQFWKQSGFMPLLRGRNFFYFNKSWTNAKTYLEALTQLKKLILNFHGKIDNEPATYIEHELQALLYSALFSSRIRESIKFAYWPSGSVMLDDDIKYSVQFQLDTFNIYRIYNEYGIFSRDMTTEYINYKFYKLSTTVNSRLLIGGFYGSRFTEPEQGILLSKLVLTGSPYYREVAKQLYNWALTPYSRSISKSDLQSIIDETFSLMLKTCNDQAFISSLKKIKSNFLFWSDKQYIPDVEFLNLQKKNVELRSFISKKATIFYATGDWSSGRYEMDDMAVKFPEINFVLINQGSSFDLWKSWNDRAEPIAYQLFLKTDSIHLDDIFLDNLNHFLVYNQNGERIGNETELTKAVQIAKGMVKTPPKEMNKSTMKAIILILAGLLIFFLVLFFFYKYRMRQRLKKQAQEKRLRELQMAAIRAQMNPHFLFNSLNSVQNLIQQNRAREAHLYLSDFAGLIRKVLRNSDKEEVSLDEELEMLEQYLKLEQLRFDFEYHIEVDSGIDKSLFMLPSMILQPFAENALMHGLQHKNGDKKLLIRISKIENAIQITVEDNGIGIQEAQKLKTKSNGVGLRMNEERIQMMKEKYGGNYSFRIIDLFAHGGEGTRVEMTIPEEI